MKVPFLFGATGAAVGLSVGFYVGNRSASKARVTHPTSSGQPEEHPAFKYGLPVGQNLRIYKQFVSSFDSRTRNPQWVLERVNRDTAFGEGNRADSKFIEDNAIPARLRNRLDDFKHSGYDRGHLAPAANHRGSQEALDETFTLSNISPQVGNGFNRAYWARVEKFVRDLTKECSDVYVVTGPLYLPTRTESGWSLVHPMIGKPPSMVAVPTHFYKVILAEYTSLTGKTQQAVGAFVMPNMDIDPQIPLSSWIVPLEDLEAAAGMQFFAPYLTPDRRSKLAMKESNLFAQLGRESRPSHILTSGTSSNVTKGRTGAVPMAIHKATLSPSSEVEHLCERTRCELVNDNWLKFNNTKAALSTESDMDTHKKR
uniref:Endonuclease n=1 Tax=Pyramimonas obovata TaxID=1411642 RepID=A0A7S0RJH0_9CHLO|mmetsp:Transcript_35809/g.78183  ORF Transcript_35809/g.78183 Transcript_35809/m.78183 type:complete len:370 (+) Transcript_35809:24-1133(+)